MAPGERYCRCPGCGECSASISAREATVTIKIGETIRWKKDDSPVLEKPESVALIDRRMAAVTIKRLLDALHAHHNNDESSANCAACRKVLAP